MSTTNELIKYLNGCDYKGRYRVQIEFGRRVCAPAYGIEAYTTDYIRGSIAYGKQKEYTSSKAAVKYLTDIAQNYLDLCSSCRIIVLNGGVGAVKIIKDDDTMFFARFNGDTITI